jgi:hypothetical protein
LPLAAADSKTFLAHFERERRKRETVASIAFRSPVVNRTEIDDVSALFLGTLGASKGSSTFSVE